jgi:hypothetical protein
MHGLSIDFLETGVFPRFLRFVTVFCYKRPTKAAYCYLARASVGTNKDFNENQLNYVYENKTSGDSGLPQKRWQLLRISQVYPRVYKFQVPNNPIGKQED